MLRRLRKHWRAILILAAIWIAFECLVSWAAFCDPANNQSAPYKSHEENSCIFNGPVASGARFFFRWWSHTFDESDSYVALFTALLVLSTVGLWWSTRELWRVTDSTLRHSELTAQRQLRAYVSVVVGGGWYQDRARNIKFGGLPSIVNTGQTPANDLAYWARAAILPNPIPESFNWPGAELGGRATLHPHHNFIANAVVPDFVDDTEVEDIKRGEGDRCLCVWGRVFYRDIFGRIQQTEFSQILTWLPDGTIFGRYERHNRAT
jgi:hypothetical protein